MSDRPPDSAQVVVIGGSVMGYIALDGRGPQEAVQAGGFQIEQAGDRHAADASLSPFFDPKGERLHREA